VNSANLYRALTEQVVPMFYNRDVNGIPREWLKRMRHSMATFVPQFTTDRMVKEYTNKYYLTK
jgi:starch phosphorylase